MTDTIFSPCLNRIFFNGAWVKGLKGIAASIEEGFST